MTEIRAQWMMANPPATRLAQWVSLAALADPQLIRAARLELRLDVAAESDLWFSPLVRTHNAAGIVFHPDAALLLREGLQSSGDLNRAWALTHARHPSLSPPIRIEEELAYRALTDGDAVIDFAEEKLAPLLRAARDPKRRALLRWAARAVPALPPQARESRAAETLAHAARESGLSFVKTGGPAPQWVRNTFGRQATGVGNTEQIGVIAFPKVVEFHHPARPGDSLVSVPPDMTFWFTWNKDGERHAQEITAQKNAVTRVACAARSFSLASPDDDFSYLFRDKDLTSRHIALIQAHEKSAAVAQYLYRQLIDRSHDVWFGAADTDVGIREITQRDWFIFVSSGNIKSPAIELARANCRRIILVDAVGMRFTFLPGDGSKWIAVRREGALQSIVDRVEEGPSRIGSVHEVPALPDWYQHSEPLETKLTRLLTGPFPQVWLTGIAGSGKSALAAAVCLSCAIRQRFPAGVIWPKDGNSWREPTASDPLDAALVVVDEPSPNHLGALREAAIRRAARDGSCLLLIRRENADSEAAHLRLNWEATDIAQLFSSPELRASEAEAQAIASLLAGDPKPAFAAAHLWKLADSPAGIEARSRVIGFLQNAADGDREQVRQILRNIDLLSPVTAFRALESGVPFKTFALAFPPKTDLQNALALLSPLTSGADTGLIQFTPGLLQTFSSTTLAAEGHQRILEYYDERCHGDWIVLGTESRYDRPGIPFHLTYAGRASEAADLLLDLDWLNLRYEESGIAGILADTKVVRNSGFLGETQRSLLSALDDCLLRPVKAPDLESTLAGSGSSIRPARTARARQIMRVDRPERWVLLLGSGNADMDARCGDVAVNLGRQLARAGIGLMTNDSDGLDGHAAVGYKAEMSRVGVPPGRSPWIENILQSIANTYPADLIGDISLTVILGGNESTAEGLELIRSPRPVIPIKDLGGAGARIYDQIHHELLKEWIAELERPIQTTRDAVRVAKFIANVVREIPLDPAPASKPSAPDQEESQEDFPR